MPAPTTDLRPEPLSVSALSAQIKGTLEDRFPSTWVVGEVSNFSRPQSGHCYFTLKDDTAQIRAVAWRGTAARLKFDLTDGLELVVRGRVDVYPPRGSYQLVVEEAHPKGVGALEQTFRRRKQKLAAEGLFDAARKRSLPSFPRRIGFVTSPTGAAVRDFLQVLERRWRGVQVLILPVRVQGEGSAEEIAHGIRTANQLAEPLDLLVIGRGGGSAEDLWAFNEEVVVRAITASEVPVISAVGHEIDVTLSDFAADVRALTPTEAAELAVPSADGVLALIDTLRNRLEGTLRRRLAGAADRLDALCHRRPFARPHALLQDLAYRLDDLQSASSRAVRRVQEQRGSSLAHLAGKLESLSPLAVLSRGYSLTTDAQGKLVRSASTLKAGSPITTRLPDGQVTSIIEQIESFTDEES